MTSDPRPPYIRLVCQIKSHTNARPLRRRPQQLSFPYAEARSVLLMDTNGINHAEFVRIIESMRPKWIVDVRAVPRLDTLAGSREYAFSIFHRMSIEYVDLLGRLGIISYKTSETNPAFWGPVAVQILKASVGPYVFLFDYPPLMSVASESLPSLLRPAIGAEAQVSVYGATRALA